MLELLHIIAIFVIIGFLAFFLYLDRKNKKQIWIIRVC